MCPIFFVHCTDYDGIDNYKKILNDNVFTGMELSGQSYNEIMGMPVKKLFDYLKWKNSLEDSKRKILEEKAAEVRAHMKNRKR